MSFKYFGYDRELNAEELKTLLPQYQAFALSQIAVMPSPSENISQGWMRYMLIYRNEESNMTDASGISVASRGQTVEEITERIQQGLENLKSTTVEERVAESSQFLQELWASPDLKCYHGREWPKIDNPNVSDYDHIVKCEVKTLLNSGRHWDYYWNKQVIFGVERHTLVPAGLITLIEFESSENPRAVN